MIDDSRSFFLNIIVIIVFFWERAENEREDHPPPLPPSYFIIIILSVRLRFNTIEREKKFLTIIWKSMIRLFGEITRYWDIDHISLWRMKNRIMEFSIIEDRTFFLLSIRNGFETNCNRERMKICKFEKKREYRSGRVCGEWRNETKEDEKKEVCIDRGSSITDSFFAQYFRL